MKNSPYQSTAYEPTAYDRTLLERVLKKYDPADYDAAILEYQSPYLLRELSHMRTNLLRVLPKNYSRDLYLCGCDCAVIRQQTARFSKVCAVSVNDLLGLDLREAAAIAVVPDRKTEEQLMQFCKEREYTLLWYRCEPDPIAVKTLTLEKGFQKTKTDEDVDNQTSLLALVLGFRQEETKLLIRFSNERDEKRSIYTEIIEKADGTRLVRKCPDSEAAREHVSRMALLFGKLQELYGDAIAINEMRMNGDSAEFAFLDSETYLDVWRKSAGSRDDSCAEKPEASHDDSFVQKPEESQDDLQAQKRAAFHDSSIAQRLDNYIRLLIPEHALTPFSVTGEFVAVFGEPNEAERALLSDMKSLPITDIDLIPENVMVQGPALIDYEWTFTFPIPTKYVIYRILNAVMLELQNEQKNELLNALQNELQESLTDSRKFLCEHYEITDAMTALFDRMEFCFQKWIEGDRILYRNMKNTLMEQPYLTIYYADTQNFSEEQAVRLAIEGKNVVVETELLSAPRFLRIDPGEQACSVRVRTAVLNGEPLILHAANGVEYGDGVYLFDVEDPILLSEELHLQMREAADALLHPEFAQNDAAADSSPASMRNDATFDTSPEMAQHRYKIELDLEILPMHANTAHAIAEDHRKYTEANRRLAELEATVADYENSRAFALGRFIRKNRK